jgi:hypothetical protein
MSMKNYLFKLLELRESQEFGLDVCNLIISIDIPELDDLGLDLLMQEIEA